jgi:hypothetical protein
MVELWGRTYSRTDLLHRVGDIRQLAAAQAFELADGTERGVRGVSLRNAAGLQVSVLTDRGMGLNDLTFRGVPIPMLTAAGSPHPAFAEPTGLGWMRTFPGGFSTPCGLTQVGSPADDAGVELGLHGRVSNLPAGSVSYGGAWEGDDYRVWVEGSVRETAVFGENLLLTRRVWTRLDEARLWIEDRVENQGFEPAPFMFLQHFNLGFPLVDATARLVLPAHKTEPRDEAARQGLAQCLEFHEPVNGYAEQVFYHYLVPDEQGQVEVRLENPAFNNGTGLSVQLRYALADYPVLVEWKCMRDGLYVVGIEPANCHVGGRVWEREHGSLQVLQPQEVRTMKMEIELS